MALELKRVVLCENTNQVYRCPQNILILLSLIYYLI